MKTIGGSSSWIIGKLGFFSLLKKSFNYPSSKPPIVTISPAIPKFNKSLDNPFLFLIRETLPSFFTYPDGEKRVRFYLFDTKP